MARKRRTRDAGQAEVQANFDEAEDQGFFGTGTEGKNRDDYTVAGVTSGGTDTNDDSRAAANTPGGAAGDEENT